MSAQLVRWGVLGAASINAAVVPALQQAERSSVIGLASRTLSKAQAAAREFGIPRTYDGYAALLADDEIDAVYIPLPNHLHFPWTLHAIRAGKHVLCEKPIAVTALEAAEMCREARGAGVRLAEAFMYAHHPRYERIRAILGSGEIGDVRAIISTFTFDASDEMDSALFQGYPGSGSLYDVGCYPIHAARYLLSREPDAVTLHAQMSTDHGNIDMLASGLLEFPGDVSVLFQSGLWAEERNTLEVLGSRGKIDVPSAFICTPGDGDFFVTVAGSSRRVAAPYANHYVSQATRFVDAILDGSELLYDAQDPIKNMAVIDACYRSLHLKERVPIATVTNMQPIPAGH